jgi:hypothetical protein
MVKSSKCESAHCVEAERKGKKVIVTDSRFPNGPKLRFTLEEWEAFRQGVLNGEFNFTIEEPANG